MKRPILSLFLFLLLQYAALGQGLQRLGTYQTGIFDDGGAEIPTYDPATQRLFVTNGSEGRIEVVDLSDPTTPTLLFSFDVAGVLPGADITSVASQGGLVAVTAEDEAGNGNVVFFDAALSGNPTEAKAIVPVGSLPDMLIFTPDGAKVLVANEGEPEDDGTDPEGSVSVIQVSDFSVTTVDFKKFNDQREALLAKGVRIFAYAESVAQDLEPEGIAISPDGRQAFVALQENNAFAVIDIESLEVLDIIPAGYKDHLSGQPELSLYVFDEPPLDEAQNILFGGLSGLFFEADKGNGRYQFITVPDRGPNGNPTEVTDAAGNTLTVRPFLIPEYQAQIIRFEVDTHSGKVHIMEKIDLTRPDGTPISGLPNLPEVDEIPAQPVDAPADFMDADGHYFKALPYDAFGADLEGIVVNPVDGTYWMVDEYRPAIYHFGTDGVLMDRLVPQGTAALAGETEGTFGSEMLPAVYNNRRANRGFEAVALDTDEDILYAFIQTPLSNPDLATGNASTVIRIIGVDPTTGEPVAEYVYLLEKPAFRPSNVDKMGDAVYDPATKRFYVIERDSGADPANKKFIYEIDLSGATNVLGSPLSDAMAGVTLESLTAEELKMEGIRPVFKRKVLNLPSIGYLPSDKPEGLALMPEGKLAVLNDNDFGLEGPDLSTVGLGIISFDKMPNALDASDRDDAINIAPWPVLGMYMPDGIVSFTVEGKVYYMTANEGDAREYDFFEEEERIGDEDFPLDAAAFPNAEMLKMDEQIGRLTATLENGDIDGDGDYDRIFTFGSRSFSIWDAYGNQVFDSGDAFEQITAQALPDYFNSSNDEAEFDSRSDAKGPEPEGVAVGMVNRKLYAFIGLERIGGIMMYDISNPQYPKFAAYVNERNFEVDQETPEAGDIAPEGLLFIAAEDSPSGSPLLVVANEVSGSTSVYAVEAPPAVTKLVLVDAKTDQDIMEITEGATIALSELPSRQLNVRAEVIGTTQSVAFSLNGAAYQPQNTAPYALFGDENGDYDDDGTVFLPGSFSLMATPYTGSTAQGMMGTPLSIHFEIVERNTIVELATRTEALSTLSEAVAQAQLVETLSSEGPFTVFAPTNAAFEALLTTLGVSDISQLDAELLGDLLRYHVVAGKVLSTDLSDGMMAETLLGGPVTFSVNGMIKVNEATVGEIDQMASNGVVHLIDQVLLPKSMVTQLVLVDAETDQDIMMLEEGAAIELTDLPGTKLNVRAEVMGLVTSVVFKLNDRTFQTQNAAPFALFSDRDGDYKEGMLPVGSHVLTATPYTRRSASGLPGMPLSISFMVTDEAVAMQASPVPAFQQVRLELTDKQESIHSFVLMDKQGMPRQSGNTAPASHLDVNLRGYQPGIYLIKVVTDRGSYLQRIVKE
ncbi:MAG: choice-of-anchor I family protein [Cyclobacteriaceae bacterium]